jgi:LysM repeat protein
MLQAWYDLRAYLRGKGVGAEIRPHSSFLSTSCPGTYLRELINDGTLALTGGIPQEVNVYTIQKGDTLSAIAARFNTTVAKLVMWNNIKYADHIEVGQKIRVTAPADTGPKGDPEPKHDYTRRIYSGRVVNERTRIMLTRAAKLLNRETLPLSQGSYNTSVSASAGTHAGGGVVDITSSSWEWAKALRRVGFAAWVRTPSEGPWGYHIHAVAIGDRELSGSAARQEAAYFNGRNALANNRADTAPSWVGRPYPDWAAKYK